MDWGEHYAEQFDPYNDQFDPNLPDGPTPEEETRWEEENRAAAAQERVLEYGEAARLQAARERTFKAAHETSARANPLYHRCGVGEVNFDRALQGEVRCTVCGAVWNLTDRGWNRNPRPYNPNHRKGNK